VKLNFISIGLVFLLGTPPANAASNEAVERNNQGVELLKQGKLDEAIGLLRKAVDLDPQNTDLRLNLAYAYDRRGREDEAIVHYQKAIELDPQNPIALNNLGVLYDRKGRNDDALRKFQKVSEIDPKSATGAQNLETAKSNQSLIQERERKIADARKNVEARPESPQAHYSLARLYAFYGKKEEAIKSLEVALKLGYHDIDYVKTDTALDGLRNEPDYVWLLRGK
jgi:tetratricopeptide (TPR) repeat protein